ncbi:MAG: hypothetical protein OEY97_08425 [Nitrospirota bacterium]|nr:hypothetical protein [Nitrospirota bacterium]
MAFLERSAQVANVVLIAVWVVGIVICLYGLTVGRRLLRLTHPQARPEFVVLKAKPIPVYTPKLR